MLDIWQLVLTFLEAVAMIMALVLMVSVLHRVARSEWADTALKGAMFSVALVYSMSDPIILGEGKGIFDMRALLVGTATGLFGLIAGLITAAIGISYRMYIGGPGVMPAIVGMTTVFVLGWVYYAFIRTKVWAEWKKSIVLGVFLSAQGTAIFAAPIETWTGHFTTLFPYMVVSSILGSFLINHLMSGELSFLSSAETLKVAANTDHLTGLLNRRGLEALHPTLVTEPAGGKGQALLYFDVDRFKQTDDTHGHAIGDDVLRHVVELISLNLRRGDVFARLGGDEFVVILQDVDENEAERSAERYLQIVSESPYNAKMTWLSLTVSIGGIWTNSSSGLSYLLHKADQALYSAKSKGRNAVVFAGQVATAA